MTTRIEYKGELIAAGTPILVPYAFWSGIQVDESFDIDAVIDRCKEIHKRDGVRIERRGRRVLFAPAYEAKQDEALA